MSEQAPNIPSSAPPSAEQKTAQYDGKIENSEVEAAQDDSLEMQQEFKRTGYLDQMPPEERETVIRASAEITEAVPDAVVMGGSALRILYESRTGKSMFGSGKGDHDIYVPRARIDELAKNPPEGYQVSQEPRFYKPDEGYIVLENPAGEHIDVFGRGDGRKSEIAEVDGHQIPVLALEEQIADKIKLGLDKNGFEDLSEEDKDKHGFYAARLLEIAEAEGDGIDETALPENWKDNLRMLASKGRFGTEELSGEETQKYLEKQKEYEELQRKIKEEQEALIAELQTVYETTHQNDDTDAYQRAQNSVSQQARINEYMNEAVPTIVETAVRATSLEDYIASLRDSLKEYADAVGERIRAKVA